MEVSIMTAGDANARLEGAFLKLVEEKPFAKITVNDIVKEAGVSKGLLFHYFESKLGVYEFVYEYSVRYMVIELSTTVSKAESNMFELMKQIEFARMNATKGYPYMQQFLNRAQSEDVGEVLVATESKRAILEAEYARLESQIRYMGFPSGVDGRKLYKMLDYTIKGLMTERFMEGAFQPEMLYKEITEYLDMMKLLVTKQGGVSYRSGIEIM
jgi:AcrR family transcriptional regulator